MSFLAPKASTPAPVQQPTVEEVDHDAEEARRRQLTEERNKRGRSSTVLTGSSGDTSDAPTLKSKLGGSS